MNTIKRISLFSLFVVISQWAGAITIVSDEKKSLEGANYEILHNFETNSGTVIAYEYNCNPCQPLTLRYDNGFEYSVRGQNVPFTANSPLRGQGDIGYDPGNLTVDFINAYQ